MSHSFTTPTREILKQAETVILHLTGQTLNVVEITKPPDIQYARHLAKVISKLSPLVGNMIEFSIVSLLNERVGRTGTVDKTGSRLSRYAIRRYCRTKARH